METRMYMLPVRCKGCNSMFDLWNTLQEQESKGGVFVSEKFQRLSQSLCPRCKVAVLSELGDLDLEIPQTKDAQTEIELTFDFE